MKKGESFIYKCSIEAGKIAAFIAIGLKAVEKAMDSLFEALELSETELKSSRNIKKKKKLPPVTSGKETKKASSKGEASEKKEREGDEEEHETKSEGEKTTE